MPFITPEFEDLAEDLAQLAIDLCGETITIRKVIDEDGDLSTSEDHSAGVLSPSSLVVQFSPRQPANLSATPK